VLFGWLGVAAFKMGMVFQQRSPAALNATLNAAVLSGRTTEPADAVEPPGKTIELQTAAGR
jgi:hypothetical protein